MVYTVKTQHLFRTTSYQVRNRDECGILTLDSVHITFSLYNKNRVSVLEHVERPSDRNMMMLFFAMTYDDSQSSRIDMTFTVHELAQPQSSREIAPDAMARTTILEYIFRATAYQPQPASTHTTRHIQVRFAPLNDSTLNPCSLTLIYGIWINGVLNR